MFTHLRVEPFFKALDQIGIRPNMMTLVSLGFGLLAVRYLFFDQSLFIMLFLANRLLDMLDGYMARCCQRQSKLGNLLDHGGDLLIFSALLLKSCFQFDLAGLAAAALGMYIGEFLLLSTKRELHRKFPTGMFAFFYLFNWFRTGLIVQIAYQVVSCIFFFFFLHHREDNR
ncbi:MAG TPA: CDP-alcohol phosphatidyltransferase family protein [bacterium]|nr:CDP-alcohol phosphatidyltransferase family protein [bacterium]